MSVHIIVALAAVAGMACGGAQHRPPAPGTDSRTSDASPREVPPAGPAYESVDIGTMDNIVPGLKVGAEKSGCGITAAAGQDLTVTCDRDTLFVRQRGTHVEFACQALEGDRCRQLLLLVIDAAHN